MGTKIRRWIKPPPWLSSLYTETESDQMISRSSTHSNYSQPKLHIMKSAILLLSFCLSALSIHAQNGCLASIPVKAGHHLSAHYPDAIVLDWKQVSPSCIKAIFADSYDSDLESEAFYSVQGEWLESHLAISQENTPASILAAIRSIYPDYTSLTSMIVEHPAKSRHYEITIQQPQTSIAVINIYPNGQIASEIATR